MLRLATDWAARYAVVTALAVTMLVIQLVAHGMTSPVIATGIRAGDTVELKTYRVGASSGASILNQGDGRTGVMAHWVSPGF